MAVENAVGAVASGIVETFSGFAWTPAKPVVNQSALVSRIIRCELLYSQFGGATQTVTKEVLPPIEGRITVIRDAFIQVDTAWITATTTAQGKVGLDAESDALLLAESWNAGLQGLEPDKKGTLIANPSTITVNGGKDGLTVTIDAGSGKTCNDLTAGRAFLFLDVLEVAEV